MSKAIIKVGKQAYKFADGIETVNRTNSETGLTEAITIEEAAKDKEFIARLINKQSPILVEVVDVIETKEAAKETLAQLETLKKENAELSEKVKELQSVIEELKKAE